MIAASQAATPASAGRAESVALAAQSASAVRPKALQPVHGRWGDLATSMLRLRQEITFTTFVEACAVASIEGAKMLKQSDRVGSLAPGKQADLVLIRACEPRGQIGFQFGMRLASLNHALLTADAVRACGLHLAGWVANGIDAAMALAKANIAALRERLPAPCLGVVPWLAQPTPAAVAARLDGAASARGAETLSPPEVNA